MSFLQFPYPPAVAALQDLDDALALTNVAPLAAAAGQDLRVALVRSMTIYDDAARAFNVTEANGVNAADIEAFSKVVYAAAGMAANNHGFVPALEPVLDLAIHTRDFLRAIPKDPDPLVYTDSAAIPTVIALEKAIATFTPKPAVSPPSTVAMDLLCAQVVDTVFFIEGSV